MSSLNYAVAHGVMKSIAQYTSADFDSLGITPEDYKLAHGDTMWTRENRRRVVATLDALIYGTIDVLGMGRFAVPTEYVAAILATFVAPLNRQVACIWMAEQGTTGSKASDLAAAGQVASTVDKSTPSQLFALVILLSQDDASTEVRQKFEAKMTQRLKAAAGVI